MGSIVLKIHAEMPKTSPEQIQLRNDEIRSEVANRLKQLATEDMTVTGVKHTELGEYAFVAFRATFKSDNIRSITDFGLILIRIATMLVDDFNLSLKAYDINPAVEIGFQDRVVIK